MSNSVDAIKIRGKKKRRERGTIPDKSAPTQEVAAADKQQHVEALNRIKDISQDFVLPPGKVNPPLPQDGVSREKATEERAAANNLETQLHETGPAAAAESYSRIQHSVQDFQDITANNPVWRHLQELSAEVKLANMRLKDLYKTQSQRVVAPLTELLSQKTSSVVLPAAGSDRVEGSNKTVSGQGPVQLNTVEGPQAIPSVKSDELLESQNRLYPMPHYLPVQLEVEHGPKRRKTCRLYPSDNISIGETFNPWGQ